MEAKAGRSLDARPAWATERFQIQRHLMSAQKLHKAHPFLLSHIEPRRHRLSLIWLRTTRHLRGAVFFPVFCTPWRITARQDLRAQTDSAPGTQAAVTLCACWQKRARWQIKSVYYCKSPHRISIPNAAFYCWPFEESPLQRSHSIKSEAHFLGKGSGQGGLDIFRQKKRVTSTDC